MWCLITPHTTSFQIIKASSFYQKVQLDPMFYSHYASLHFCNKKKHIAGIQKSKYCIGWYHTSQLGHHEVMPALGLWRHGGFTGQALRKPAHFVSLNPRLRIPCWGKEAMRLKPVVRSLSRAKVAKVPQDGRKSGADDWSSLNWSRTPRQRASSPENTWVICSNEKGTHKWGCILQCKFPAAEDLSSVRVAANSWWM